MSIELMAAVFYLRLPPGPKLLLLALADNANDSGHAWPSQETLALKTSCDVRSVRRQTRLLEAEGWAEIAGDPSRSHSLHYFLNTERIKAGVGAGKADTDAGKADKADIGDRKGGHLEQERRTLVYAGTIIEPSLEPPYAAAAPKNTRRRKPSLTLLSTKDLLALFSEEEMIAARSRFPGVDLEWEAGKCAEWHNARGGSGNWKLAFKNWLERATPVQVGGKYAKPGGDTQKPKVEEDKYVRDKREGDERKARWAAKQAALAAERNRGVLS